MGTQPSSWMCFLVLLEKLSGFHTYTQLKGPFMSRGWQMPRQTGRSAAARADYGLLSLQRQMSLCHSASWKPYVLFVNALGLNSPRVSALWQCVSLLCKEPGISELYLLGLKRREIAWAEDWNRDQVTLWFYFHCHMVLSLWSVKNFSLISGKLLIS